MSKHLWCVVAVSGSILANFSYTLSICARLSRRDYWFLRFEVCRPSLHRWAITRNLLLTTHTDLPLFSRRGPESEKFP